MQPSTINEDAVVKARVTTDCTSIVVSKAAGLPTRVHSPAHLARRELSRTRRRRPSDLAHRGRSRRLQRCAVWLTWAQRSSMGSSLSEWQYLSLATSLAAREPCSSATSTRVYTVQRRRSRRRAVLIGLCSCAQLCAEKMPESKYRSIDQAVSHVLDHLGSEDGRIRGVALAKHLVQAGARCVEAQQPTALANISSRCNIPAVKMSVGTAKIGKSGECFRLKMMPWQGPLRFPHSEARHQTVRSSDVWHDQSSAPPWRVQTVANPTCSRSPLRKTSLNTGDHGLQSTSCCFHCGKCVSRMGRCQKCQQACFCSRECQEEAWPSHKAACKTITAAQRKAMAISRRSMDCACTHDEHLAYLPCVLQVRSAALL
jgi:MYND finger